MAREIKFRGFNRKNGVWLHGFYLMNRGAHFVCPDEFADGKSWDDYEIDPETLGQYTGQKDKDGREIYEGDIAVWHCTDTGFKVKIVWEESAARFTLKGIADDEDLSSLDSFETRHIKVIGNIHDNPELLKGKEDESV